MPRLLFLISMLNLRLMFRHLYDQAFRQVFIQEGRLIEGIRYLYLIILNIAGFVSNGEYNSMRAKGYTRPLSIFQIRAAARKKFSSIGRKSMLAMLTPRS